MPLNAIAAWCLRTKSSGAKRFCHSYVAVKENRTSVPFFFFFFDDSQRRTEIDTQKGFFLRGRSSVCVLTTKNVAPGPNIACGCSITRLESYSMDCRNLWFEPQRDFFFFSLCVRNKVSLKTKEICCLTDVVEVFLFGPAGHWLLSSRRTEEDDHSKKVTCDIFAQTCEKDAARKKRERNE